MQLLSIPITTEKHKYFSDFWEIYNDSFPVYEKRNLNQQVEVFSKTNYFLNSFIDNNIVVAFLEFWDYPEFCFIEHFAVNKTYRSKGYGKILLDGFISSFKKPIILEIDPITEEISAKRLKFYQSLGFIENNYEHYQPPYRNDENPVPLKILTHPVTISQELYNLFQFIQKNIIVK